MSENGKLPASAWVEFDTSDGHYEGRYPIWQQHHGLTKREAFAMAAMQGLLVSPPEDRPSLYERSMEEAVALASVSYADALLAALDPTP